MSLYFIIVILISLVAGGVLYKTMGSNQTSFLCSLLIVVAGAFILLSSDANDVDDFNARRDVQEPTQFKHAEQDEINSIIANLATHDENAGVNMGENMGENARDNAGQNAGDNAGQNAGEGFKPSKPGIDFDPEANINYDEANKNSQEKSKIVPQKIADDEFDIDVYNGVGDIENIYRKMGTIGDNLICNRMKYMGMQPKLSKDIRAAYNKYTMQPMFEEELREQADKIWWENDQLDLFM